MTQTFLCLLLTLVVTAVPSAAQDAARGEGGGQGFSTDVFAPGDDALEDVTIEEKLGQKLPLTLSFIDENGATRTLADYFKNDGRPVVLQLGYFECPMLCGLVAEGMVDSLKGLEGELGTNYAVLNVSINPKETHAVAQIKRREAMRLYGRPAGEGGWTFLVGNEYAIRDLTAAAGFKYKYIPQDNVYSHPAALIICTSDGTISKYLYGVKFDPQDLGAAITAASAGDVGTAGEGFILTCFQMMKNIGKNTLAAVSLMQLAGALTVVAIVGVVGSMFVWEHYRGPHRLASTDDSNSSSGPSV